MDQSIIEEVRRYLEEAPAEVRELAPGFRALKWGVEEIKQYLITARKVGSAAVEVDEQGGLIAEVEEARVAMGYGVDCEKARKIGRHVTTMNVELTEEEKQILREDLKAVTVIEFKPVGRGSRVKHAIPHGLRTAMTLQLFRAVPKGARVLEVGANVLSAVKRGAIIGRYFGLVPILSPTDAVRWNQQLRAVQVLNRVRGRGALKPVQAEVAAAIIKDSSVMFADMKLQDVKGQFDYIVSIQSNWDIPIVDIPRAMRRVGASTYAMVFDRVPGLNFYTGKRSGCVEDLGLRWEADADADEISFFFDQDSSFGYKHSFKNVRDYQLLVGRHFRCEGRTYVFKEAPYSTRLQLALVCVDLGVRELAEDVPYTYADSGCKGMVRVTVPVRKFPVSLDERVTFQSVDFDVDETALCRVLQDRMIMGAKGDATTTLKFVKSNRFSIVHNGVRVSVGNPVAVEQFRAFSVAVDALAVDMMAASEKDIGAVVSSLANGGRKFQGPFQTIMRTAAECVTGPGTLFDSVVLRLRAMTAERIEGRVAVERLSPVRKIRNLPIVNVDAVGVSALVHRSCYCFERDEALAMLEGNRGGISDLEHHALSSYYQVLKERTCTACLRTPIDFEREIREADEDEFFDCVSTVGTSSDSGYESDKNGIDRKIDVKSCNSQENLHDFANAVGSDECDEVDSDGIQNDLREQIIIHELEKYTDSVAVANMPLTVMRAAVMEYASILRDQMKAADSYTQEVLRIAGISGQITQETLDFHCNDREWHSLVRVGMDGRLTGVSKTGVKFSDFQRVFDYDTGLFHGVVRSNGAYFVVGKCSSTVYTSSKYRVWNQPAILKSVVEVLSGDWLDGPEVRMPFVNGVPGCGKTTGVEQAYRRDVKTVGQRLVLSATLSSVVMVREHLFGELPVGKQLVRSYDSLLVWGTRYKFEEVVFDEMAALHPGQLFSVLAILQPKYVRGYGDFKQMEYKSFLGNYKPKYSSLERFCDMEYLRHTHRNRVSIVASNLDWYDNIDLCVCNCCDHIEKTDEGGIDVCKIDSLGQIPVVENVMYLTYTQEEKERVRGLLRAGGFGKDQAEEWCKTMAESQGRTVDSVYAIRLEHKHKPDSIYFERDRVNVGRTRAKLEVKYFTVSSEVDEMCIASKDSRSEFLREKIRQNSHKFVREVQECGGMEKYLEPFFGLKPIEYR